MKKYDSYKDSGIEWIGEIPEHWNINRLRNIADSIKTGSTPPSEEIQYFEPKDINWYGPGDFDDLILYDAKRKISNLSIKENICRLFPPNSILLIGIGATVGKVGIVSEASTSNQQINSIILKNEYNPKYYTYFISTIKDIIVMEASSATLPIFNQTQTKNIVLPVPEIFEQTTIANYLDHKTTQIDTLIAKKEQFISLLQEERTAVINQAVTKGLDPKVKMKDSGIEWLGEIPEHWEVAKFNLYVSIRHGHQFMNHDFTDDGVKVVKITQLHKDGYLDLSKCSYVSSEQLENYQSILIKEKDILMCLTGGTIGKIIRVGEVNEPLLQNYRVGHFSSGKASKISDDFIFWLMSSESIVSQIFFQMRETGQPNIGMDDFGRMRITIPPLMEQEKIVKHIVNKTVEISEILIKSKQEIELLKEYKTALISEVVTGKVDVRDVILN